ncbi:hypothetical protein [Methanobacterium lacus]|uniref:hypothetical protein n=1 Tax=Methanobacterium lacus (strain AL-21) TaxID=877455 RepID=UPI00117CA010|nr:hypothetical protein [Methanobacterium lacus]
MILILAPDTHLPYIYHSVYVVTLIYGVNNLLYCPGLIYSIGQFTVPVDRAAVYMVILDTNFRYIFLFLIQNLRI